MLQLQSPLTGNHQLRPKSGRKPLQPKNSQTNDAITEIQILKPKPNPKQERIEISVVGYLNKENHPIYASPTKLIEPLDASLAEELSAIRKKLERLRLDKERTEKMLKEREVLLDLQMKELEQRGEVQKMLEMEVDRLYRLKEFQSYSMRISPIRSLREKEHEKKVVQVHLRDFKSEDLEGSMAESTMQSPGSSPSSVTSEFIANK